MWERNIYQDVPWNVSGRGDLPERLHVVVPEEPRLNREKALAVLGYYFGGVVPVPTIYGYIWGEGFNKNLTQNVRTEIAQANQTLASFVRHGTDIYASAKRGYVWAEKPQVDGQLDIRRHDLISKDSFPENIQDLYKAFEIVKVKQVGEGKNYHIIEMLTPIQEMMLVNLMLVYPESLRIPSLINLLHGPYIDNLNLRTEKSKINRWIKPLDYKIQGMTREGLVSTGRAREVAYRLAPIGV